MHCVKACASLQHAFNKTGRLDRDRCTHHDSHRALTETGAVMKGIFTALRATLVLHPHRCHPLRQFRASTGEAWKCAPVSCRIPHATKTFMTPAGDTGCLVPSIAVE
jgi:hypothetical protein